MIFFDELPQINLRHSSIRFDCCWFVKTRTKAEKYNLSCHSLVHVWLRKLGNITSENRQTRSAYIGIENFQTLPEKSKKGKPLTDEQKQIEVLKKRLEDANLLAEAIGE